MNVYSISIDQIFSVYAVLINFKSDGEYIARIKDEVVCLRGLQKF